MKEKQTEKQIRNLIRTCFRANFAKCGTGSGSVSDWRWQDSVMTERADLAGIGRRIAEIRGEVGLTQEQLAERAGISVVHLCNIEPGKKTPGLTVLIRIAEALEVVPTGSCGRKRLGPTP